MNFKVNLFSIQLLSAFRCVRIYVCVCVSQFRPLSATLAAFTPKNNGERHNCSSSFTTVRARLVCVRVFAYAWVTTINDVRHWGSRVWWESEQDWDSREREKKREAGFLDSMPRRPCRSGVWRVLNYTVCVCVRTTKVCAAVWSWTTQWGKLEKNITTTDFFKKINTDRKWWRYTLGVITLFIISCTKWKSSWTSMMDRDAYKREEGVGVESKKEKKRRRGFLL